MKYAKLRGSCKDELRLDSIAALAALSVTCRVSDQDVP